MEKASKDNNYHYNSRLQPLANQNKKNLTKSAMYMWNILRGKNILGYRFRRERPILNYIVDFCCLELMLVIEVDGLSHDTAEMIAKDLERDKILESIGFTVLRFDTLYVINHQEDALKDVLFWVEKNR